MLRTDVEIRAARSAAKVVKLNDGGGLQLWLTSDGVKHWRLAHRFAGKQKALALGVYPDAGFERGPRAQRRRKCLACEGARRLAEETGP
jgi:hypothetical protein